MNMCINTEEDKIYVTTQAGQLIQGWLDLKSPIPADAETHFDYVQGIFHKEEITGLDVCIRKQLVVTCSKDKFINIWNYEKRELEIAYPTAEECLAVAFHPSGLHIVVAL